MKEFSHAMICFIVGMGIGALACAIADGPPEKDSPARQPLSNPKKVEVADELLVYQAGSGWLVVRYHGYDKSGVCFVPSSAGWDGQIK